MQRSDVEEGWRRQSRGGVLLQVRGREHGSRPGVAGCTVPLMGWSTVGPPGIPHVHPIHLLRDLRGTRFTADLWVGISQSKATPLSRLLAKA